MFFPSNSAGSSYPRMRAAEGFEKRQVPSESQPQIASEAESSMSRISSSLWGRMPACSRWDSSSESDINEVWLLQARQPSKHVLAVAVVSHTYRRFDSELPSPECA